jgi:hypothetical protein
MSTARPRSTWLIRWVAVAALLALVVPAGAQTDYQDYGSGGGGGCDYCNRSACGCAPPPAGMTLTFSCSCSSITCTRSCDYT